MEETYLNMSSVKMVKTKPIIDSVVPTMDIALRAICSVLLLSIWQSSSVLEQMSWREIVCLKVCTCRKILTLTTSTAKLVK